MFKITSIVFLALWQLIAIPIVGGIAQNGSANIVQTSSFPASDQGVSVVYMN
jgi:hypothetical protein